MTLVIGPAVAMIFVIIMMLVAKESTLPPTSKVHHTDKSSDSDFKYVLKSPIFYLIIGASMAYAWAMNAFTDLTPGYIAIDPPMGIGRGPAGVGSLMPLVQLGNIVGALCSGIITDRVFKGNVKPVLVGAFLIQCVSTLSVKFPFVYNNTLLFGFMLFLVGFSITSIMPSISTFIATNMPNSIVGKVFSVSFGISLIAGAVGVSVGSAVLHFTGSYQGPIIIVSLVALVGFFPALFFEKPKRFRVQEEGAIKA